MNDYETAGTEATIRDARPWLECIGDAKKYFQLWLDKCDSIDKLYADLRRLADVSGDREFQMFWANLEVLRPSIYSRPPQPAVATRFKDMSPMPRNASAMLERALIVNVEIEDINAVMLAVRDDMLINGRGVAWVRYEDDSDPTEEIGPAHEPRNQRVPYEHVDRADFLHEPARKWPEVGWVAKRAWLTRDQGIARFGDIFARIDLKERQELSDSETGYKGEKKGEVWEIWSKTRNCVVWIAEGVEEVLDIRAPFLKLDGFFPCPKPAYSTLERRKLIPVPDYYFCRDQFDEINELTARISALAEGLRMKGFYAAGAGDLAEAVEAALRQQDNNAILVPVANFAALGGAILRDSIIWLPITEVAATIRELLLLRRQIIDDVYQITGLSDIMRGVTEPQETATAQELKSQYGSVRIRERQIELVRFARDLVRIAGEIMAENFTPETFTTITQMSLPTTAAIQEQARKLTENVAKLLQKSDSQSVLPDQLQEVHQETQERLNELAETVTIDQVVALLREQRIRPFVLEIETDSTIQADENMEKQRRTEFLSSLAGVIQQLTPLVQAQPAAGPFAAEMIKFSVAPFRAGRAMTAVIEDFTETIREQAQQAATNPQAGPAQLAAQSEGQRFEFEKQKHADEMALKSKELDQVNDREIRKARIEGDLAGNAAGQPAAYSMSEVITQLAGQNAQVLQALAVIGQILAAPKSVTTPEGRIYTTQPSSPPGMN
ncbi:hypothetical protein [Taklimakanibacter albus]|uniref:Uncharacterized protein n=1 Tax=Taklimakanibacter albus TaxID=2800327 RepID=A0ACC5RBT9_9HYPH|nr:hypothetical protein [Aestuariivirga sp. YIM B02566]MBK1870090.1 hypothetical protein [Aestuariivirga sp. YIM B02566]